MILQYKNFLLNKINSVQAIFYRDLALEYARDLGYTCKDYYEASAVLQYIDDSKFCGEGVNDRGVYFLYDRSGNVYWFRNYKDACLFAGIEECSLNMFINFRRHWFNDFLWLLKEDIEYIGEILTTPKGVYCETKGFGFESVDDAARWIANCGYAINAETAKKQLIKHLEGKTSLCYKMKFIEY